MTTVQTPLIADPAVPPVVPVACPLCHTVEIAVTEESLQAGGTWTCATCGQLWSARRLETVAAYARYAAAH